MTWSSTLGIFFIELPENILWVVDGGKHNSLIVVGCMPLWAPCAQHHCINSRFVFRYA